MKSLTDTLASTQRGDQPARICPHCGDEQMRRLARRGFLQTRIYPLLGLYPWECVACRTIKMFRKRGKPAFRRIWDE